MRVLEECPPPPMRQRVGETGPGLQGGSDHFLVFPRRIWCCAGRRDLKDLEEREMVGQWARRMGACADLR